MGMECGKDKVIVKEIWKWVREEIKIKLFVKIKKKIKDIVEIESED